MAPGSPLTLATVRPAQSHVESVVSPARGFLALDEECRYSGSNCESMDGNRAVFVQPVNDGIVEVQVSPPDAPTVLHIPAVECVLAVTLQVAFWWTICLLRLLNPIWIRNLNLFRLSHVTIRLQRPDSVHNPLRLQRTSAVDCQRLVLLRLVDSDKSSLRENPALVLTSRRSSRKLVKSKWYQLEYGLLRG